MRHKKHHVVGRNDYTARKQDTMEDIAAKGYDELLQESKRYLLEHDAADIDMDIVEAYQERLNELELNVQEYNQEEEWMRLNA